jgi:hypothetical protein
MEELPVIFGVVFPRQRGKETVPGQPPHRPTLGTSARAKGSAQQPLEVYSLESESLMSFAAAPARGEAQY